MRNRACRFGAHYLLVRIIICKSGRNVRDKGAEIYFESIKYDSLLFRYVSAGTFLSFCSGMIFSGIYFLPRIEFFDLLPFDGRVLSWIFSGLVFRVGWTCRIRDILIWYFRIGNMIDCVKFLRSVCDLCNYGFRLQFKLIYLKEYASGNFNVVYIKLIKRLYSIRLGVEMLLLISSINFFKKLHKSLFVYKVNYFHTISDVITFKKGTNNSHFNQ